MDKLESAKNKLAEMRRALERGDTSIMPDELAAAQNTVAALENNKPEASPEFGKLTPQGIASIQKQGLMTPSLRMAAGYQKTENNNQNDVK